MGLDVYSKNNQDNILVFDTETETAGSRPNGQKDKLKIFGYYSYKEAQYKVLSYSKKNKTQEVINSHRFLVGFNNENYDNPVLENFGIKLGYKRHIDLYKIIKERAKSMITDKGMLDEELMRFSLDYITRFLDLADDNTAKGTIDYSIFKKNSWSPEEIKEIKFYTKRDVELTKKLYEWLENYFESSKDFLPQKEIDGKYYLTDRLPKFAYKAICHALGWEPEYNRGNIEIPEEDKISGGYVAFPAGEKFEGVLIQEDFASLYPHIIMQCNLYGRVENPENKEDYWHGGGMWDVKGYYKKDALHPICKLIRTFYYLRLFYKRKGFLVDGTPLKFKEADKHIGEKFFNIHIDENKKMVLFEDEITEEKANYLKDLAAKGKDTKEYTIKIIINIIYGILNTPYYKLVHDAVAGGDCTRLGRQWIKYARKRYREEGYKIIYSDSVTKDTQIRLMDGEQISIEDYWNKYTRNKDSDDKEWCDCTEPILVCDDQFKNKLVTPKRIIRHKTKKKMYHIELTNMKTLDVTQDHSLITIDPNTQKLVSLKPEELFDKKHVLVNCKNIYKTDMNKESKTGVEENSRDFSLMRVKSISTYEIDDYVYDFSIDKYERFYANDVLVHNTDSWYFEDVYNDRERFIKLKDKVIEEIKATLPFPQHTFDADIDSEMKYMFFFKGENKNENDAEYDEDDYINCKKGLMKKNYIYVTNDDKLVIKNLGIKQKSISGISKKIFWDYMVPQIKKGKIKYSSVEIENKMIEYLQQDINLAFMRKNVKDVKAYSKSTTSIHYKIAEKYGEGVHFLVPNIRNIGVGEDVKYCSKEEFDKYDMGINDIDFTNFWKELNYFIKPKQQINLFNVNK